MRESCRGKIPRPIINYWRVFAAVDEASSVEVRPLSKVINTEDYPLRKLSSMTASETAKIVENTYRAINIALVDEWSQFAGDCEYQPE